MINKVYKMNNTIVSEMANTLPNPSFHDETPGDRLDEPLEEASWPTLETGWERDLETDC